jgi:hypothetical protein
MDAWIPAEPPVPPEQRGTGRLALRYEDISQNGDLLMEAIPAALGELWRRIDGPKRAALGTERGVIPLLSRVVIEGGEGPISIHTPAETAGAYQLAHTVGADGEVDRIILGMWSHVTSVVGRTQGAQPADAGRPVVAGRVFAEHVFTRPFGPPEQRKVRALQIGGASVVPPDRWTWRDADAALALPPGAAPLDADLVPDAAFTVFGLDHTDGNQHTNSLVYTRLFIEAALRRLDAHGRARPPLRCRAMEIAYRKPSFAGDRVRVLVRAFAEGSQLGAAAALVSEEEASAPREKMRPRVYARMLFGG